MIYRLVIQFITVQVHKRKASCCKRIVKYFIVLLLRAISCLFLMYSNGLVKFVSELYKYEFHSFHYGSQPSLAFFEGNFNRVEFNGNLAELFKFISVTTYLRVNSNQAHFMLVSELYSTGFLRRNSDKSDPLASGVMDS